MRTRIGMLPVLAAAICCCGDPTPDSPREVIRKFAVGFESADYDAVDAVVHGDDSDRAYLRSAFAFFTAARAFKARMLEVYGEDGWAQFNDNADASLTITEPRDPEVYERMDVRVQGDSAVARDPSENRPLHLTRRDGHWFIDLRASMGLPEARLEPETRMFNGFADLYRKKMARIGAAGVTADSLDAEMGPEISGVILAAEGEDAGPRSVPADGD
ncbi:MAG: hypothetical protein ACYTGZ_17755 [Planctomycetota bacterium]|jgi:hypothetical protein